MNPAGLQTGPQARGNEPLLGKTAAGLRIHSPPGPSCDFRPKYPHEQPTEPRARQLAELPSLL